MRKIKLQKIVGNLIDKLRKLYMNGTVIQEFLAFPKVQKILGNFCLSEQIFYRKLCRWVPLNPCIKQPLIGPWTTHERRDTISCKVSCFLLKFFHIRRLQKRQVFSQYKSLYFVRMFRNNADARRCSYFEPGLPAWLYLKIVLSQTACSPSFLLKSVQFLSQPARFKPRRSRAYALVYRGSRAWVSGMITCQHIIQSCNLNQMNTVHNVL